jgi:hypothetical protein
VIKTFKAKLKKTPLSISAAGQLRIDAAMRASRNHGHHQRQGETRTHPIRRT